MKRIIHLSDLHVGYKHCGQNLKKIIDEIQVKYSADSHVVLVTGDVVDNANTEGSYERAGAQLRRLEEKGFLVLIVPGNHDYGSGSIGNKKYVKQFKRAFFDNERITYPKVDIDGDIAFIGMDSMEDTFDWLDIFGADGELGNKQLKRLAKVLGAKRLKKKKKVVYLHHHPFDARGRLHMLKDYRQFKRVVEGKIDCLLFGHNHDGNQYPGVWGIKQCYDGSSSTGKSQENGKPATPMRIISLES